MEAPHQDSGLRKMFHNNAKALSLFRAPHMVQDTRKYLTKVRKHETKKSLRFLACLKEIELVTPIDLFIF
jgi:hypothetical protein